MKKLLGLGLVMFTVAACTSAEDVAGEAALMYSAPFLAVSNAGDCDHKIGVARELHKMQKDDHVEVKGKVDGVKDDPAFAKKLKAEVEKVQKSAASKGFQEDCPAESKELATIVADTAKALGIDSMVSAWPGE